METETTPTEAPAPAETPEQAAMRILAEADQEPAEGAEPGQEGAEEGQPAEGAEQPEGEPQEPTEPEPAKEEPKPEDKKLASRFAALAREEKRVRQQRETLKQEQAQLASFKSAVEKIRTDPLGALKELGVDYDDLTRRVLSGGKPGPEDEIRELRERQERFERERQEQAERAQQAQVEQAFTQAKRELGEMSRDSGKYPLASAFEAAEVAENAFAIIERHFAKTGKALSFNEALGEIETRLEAQRDRLLKAKPMAPATPPKTPPKAITNRMATEPGTAPRELTYEERIEKARRIARGEDV